MEEDRSNKATMDAMGLKLCPYHSYISLKSTNISLLREKNKFTCAACYEGHDDNIQSYTCDFCDFYVHEGCISPNIPSRHKHPLKLTPYSATGSYRCRLCDNQGNYGEVFYICSQCSFSICIPCARKPLIFNQPKAHEHELFQLVTELSFTCNACGLCYAQYPCICLQCSFIIHRACIVLPRVININRHNHRISHVSSPGPGKWICRICHDHVNGEYGAYSCFTCPYVVHSKCATDYLFWDGIELEGIPEKDEKEESKPFEVIDQNLIKHFSHEHNLKLSAPSLRLEEDALPSGEDKHCYACTLFVYSELCYECTQCDFILHDTCANLPRKRRHVISVRQLTLYAKGYVNYFENHFRCDLCGRYCTGFRYKNESISIDVRCASVSDPFKHESHPHLLFIYASQQRYVSCDGCGLVCWFRLRCDGKDDCGGYNLCFRCITLPTSVRHKYDDHPLSLCYGEKNVKATYCCGICEEEIYLNSWFYKCNECGFTLHNKCVFENLLHSRPGYNLLIKDNMEFEILPNNRLSRPICYSCKTRCTGDLVLNNKDTSISICCSCGLYWRYWS